jgi:hypothetical protein
MKGQAMSEMDYVQLWYQDWSMSHRPDSLIKRAGEAWGVFHKHTGPSIKYGKVKIAISPGADLEVVDALDQAKSDWLKANDCFDQITFGVLDVMLTMLPPINQFKMIILDADYDEVQSVPIAFRLAAREAARKILDEQGSLSQ